MSYLSPDSVELKRVRTRAIEIATGFNHDTVTLEHLLVSLIEEPDVQEAMKALTINCEDIAADMTVFLSSDFISVIETNEMTPINSHLFERFIMRAATRGSIDRSRGAKAMPIHVLVEMSEWPADDSFALTTLAQSGLDSLSLKRFISHGAGGDMGGFGFGMGHASGMMGEEFGGNAREITNPEDAQALLAKYCMNLNETAANGKIDPLIGREEEVNHIIQIVARRTKNNVALVGEPGVGKTAIAEGLALKISRGEVPEVIKDAVVYSLDIGSLMAGTRFRGDLEERMKQVLKALTFLDGAILFIDEIHTIMGTGSSQGTLDIANLLKPALAKGDLRCIGSTTYEEFRKNFEKDRALLRRFKRVDILEPDVESSKKILRGLKEHYEAFHSVNYTDAAIDAAVELTSRYINNALLPDKAIDIIDGAGAAQRVALPEKRLSVIDVEQIEAEVSKVAKIPAQNVKEDETEKLGRLEEDLRAAVFGQDDALSALSDAVFVSRSGLRDDNKPAGCFLFAGPTGVGKTQAALQLAATLGVPLLRFDMSEYMEKHSVAKLIGSPPGYVGFGDGGAGSGKLINDIDSSPYSVLLLDEIEKAHSDVYNVFLQVMDDAKLTSSSGKTVDFRNVIIVMTTNAGARELVKKSMGFSPQTENGDASAEINRLFTPEFRNRLDAIVNFDRLKPENVIKVVEKFLLVLTEQAKSRNVEIVTTDAAKEMLSKIGYDENMGARPLARAISEHVKKPLSRLMVVGSLKNGGKALVDVVDDKITVVAQ
jgi:ATP-dependent Clp protease ATP-binding subunit ClpA